MIDILLATTPSPSEGWQHSTAALETPEMAQHKFIDKYDLPDAGKRILNVKNIWGSIRIDNSIVIPKMVNFSFLMRFEMVNSLMMPIVVKLEKIMKIMITICKDEIMDTHEIMNSLGLIVFEVYFYFLGRELNLNNLCK